MGKIILLDSSYPINTRNQKIVNSLIGFEINIIAWNRDDRANNTGICKEYIFRRKSPYGNPFRKLFNLLFYARFIKQIVRKIIPNYIIASHWDMLLIASLMKEKYSKLIYENLDMPTANSRIVLWALRKLERIALKKQIVLYSLLVFMKTNIPFSLEKHIFWKTNLSETSCLMDR